MEKILGFYEEKPGNLPGVQFQRSMEELLVIFVENVLKDLHKYIREGFLEEHPAGSLGLYKNPKEEARRHSAVSGRGSGV